jgi:hypothetical protein
LLSAVPSAGAGAVAQVPTQCMSFGMSLPRLFGSVAALG